MTMIFMPNMAQMKLDIKEHAPTKQASDILQKLCSDIQKVAEKNDKAGQTFRLSDYHLVDTNLNSISDLTWYLSFPQEQLALFVMHNDTYNEGKNLKANDPQFKFNSFIQKIVMDQQNALKARKEEAARQEQQQQVQQAAAQQENQVMAESSDDDRSVDSNNKVVKQKPSKKAKRNDKMEVDQGSGLARYEGSTITKSQLKKWQDKKKTKLDMIFEFIKESDKPIKQLSAELNLNPHLLRLIKHQLGKQDKNDMETQPFSFTRPRNKMKKYQFTAQKVLKQSNAQLDKPIEAILKAQLLDTLPIQLQNGLSYEARLEAAENSQYGIKMSYPKLKAFYKEHGVSKSEYQEPDADRGRRMRSQKQIDQLLAMHLADLKILEHRLIYVDLVQACLEDLLLVFRPATHGQGQQAGAGYEKVWVQSAIDSTMGLIGFQLYFKMPSQKEMQAFFAKISNKINQKKCSSIQAQPKWLICPENRATSVRSLNQCIANEDNNMKLILLSSEEANSRFNNCRGLWPYLAQVWESKQVDIQSKSKAADNENNVTKLCKRLANCFFRLNQQNVAAIASSFNNQQILKTLREKENFQEPVSYDKEGEAEKNVAYENW